MSQPDCVTILTGRKSKVGLLSVFWREQSPFGLGVARARPLPNALSTGFPNNRKCQMNRQFFRTAFRQNPGLPLRGHVAWRKGAQENPPML